jgi:hypothetical protein
MSKIRKLAAILAADVAGYSRLAGADEERTLARLRALRSDLTDLRSLRADVASDLGTMQRETREQIVGLGRAVVEYRSAVVGHGLIISEREERVRRLEQRLNLPSLERG